MTEFIVLGDIYDFHACWCDGEVFHVSDTTDNKISAAGLELKCTYFENNLVYFDGDTVVYSNTIVVRDQRVFSADNAEICCFSNGWFALQNGYVLDPYFKTIHKFSDMPCFLEYNAYMQRLTACSMSGELVVFSKGYLQHYLKTPVATRGQIPFATIRPTCCYANAYLVTVNGARMITYPQNVVFELKYQGIRKVEASSRIIGLTDSTLEFFEISAKRIRILARVEFSDIRVIDCLAIDKQTYFDCCVVYYNLDDSFKCARYQRIQCTAPIQNANSAAETIKQTANERPAPEEKLDVFESSDGLGDEDSEHLSKSIEISALTKNDDTEQSLSNETCYYTKGYAEAQKYFVYQFFTYSGEDVVSSFESPLQKYHHIYESPATIFITNQHGMIVGAPAGQYYQVTVKAGALPVALSFHRTCLHADLGAEEFCLLLEDHLLLQRLQERYPHYRASFSPALTGNLIKLIDSETVAATFYHGPSMYVLTVFRGGIPVFNRTSQCFSHLTAYAGLLFAIKEDTSLEVYDVHSLKTVYSGYFHIGRITFFQSTGARCFAASQNGIFYFDFEDSFGSAVGIAPVYSFLEHSIVEVRRLQELVLRVMSKTSKEQLTRSDLEYMRTRYLFVVYCEEVEHGIEFYCLEVEQAGLRLDSTRDYLLRISRGEELNPSYDAAEEFEKDIIDVKYHFPNIIQPQFDLSAHPDFVALQASAPVNSGSSYVDEDERRFIVELMRLRSAYALAGTEAGMAKADIVFDLALIEYAKRLAEHQLRSRLDVLPHLCRTRDALDGLRAICARAGFAGTAEVCLQISEELFNDAQFARESAVLPTLQFGDGGLFAKRMDDLGFSFLSGEARARFDELGKELRAKVEDCIRTATYARQNKTRTSPSVPRSPESVMYTQEDAIYQPDKRTTLPDYSNLQPAPPDANQQFKQLLRGKNQKQTPQIYYYAVSRPPPKVSQQSASPLKQLSLGDALGGL